MSRLVIVTLRIVSNAPEFTLTSVPLLVPSMMVLPAPAPWKVRVLAPEAPGMVRCSAYVPAAMLIVAPLEAASTAPWMVE